ncbi:hypothetical protein [Bacillus cereus group sp. BfR-BA-00999]|uniref:hypothetical protein n=1 Tax=Bacillus cereus group sp. BfR-BA-00999 TaxID=3094871 RepID=UPI0029C52D28|nr:hypothetical protein [Bacillus cereus group sp. BfR-BA-00999]MDX5884882.1 hypothetical protein [Bacillus cereus group sp. BfR-BA-00999]
MTTNKTTTKKKNRHRSRNNNGNQNFSYERFASTSASVNGTNSSASKGISEARLKQMLQDPAKNSTAIAGLSKGMKQINGMYKGIIRYMSAMMTFDHVLYPVMEDPLSFAEDPKEMQLAFAQTAIFLHRLNIKFNLPMFTEKILVNGAIFLYKLEDSKSVAYMEFPLNLCRISFMDENVYRYQMDISKLTEATMLLYPKEIQNAYTSLKNGQTEKLVEGKWYQLSDKGVAFTLDVDAMTQGGLSVPPLASALIDVIKIENAKDSMETTANLDNTKIVHSKIETDDKGRPLMELPVVMEYHNALKRNLPEGSVAITNPFETKGITLNGTGKDGKFSLLEKTIENLYDDAGVSKMLFAGDGASSQALERSIQVDAQYLYSFLLPMFANYYNYELKKASKKGTSWIVKFLATSWFGKDEAIKTAKDQLTFGGSRLEYLAHTGMTPIEVANMLIFEQRVLSIDDYMIAKQTSNTLSGNPQEGKDGEVGRPETENPTDTTVRIKDSQ